MPRFLGYVRVSKGEQAKHGYSLQAQIDRLKIEYEYMRHSIPDLEMGRTYVEKGESAWSIPFRARTEGGNLDATARDGDIIVVVHLDRAFRSVGDCSNTYTHWRDRGIEFRVAGGEIDTRTAQGKLAMNVLASFAQFESDQKSEKIKAAKARKRTSKAITSIRPGKPMVWWADNRQIPLDHANTWQGKTLEDRRRQAAICRYVLHCRGKGMSYEDIGNRISRMEAKRTGQKYKSAQWGDKYSYRKLREFPDKALFAWPKELYSQPRGFGICAIPAGWRDVLVERRRREHSAA